MVLKFPIDFIIGGGAEMSGYDALSGNFYFFGFPMDFWGKVIVFLAIYFSCCYYFLWRGLWKD